MLGWLPPFRLLMGLRSPKRLLLFLGLMTVLEEEDISFLRPLVRSLERSRILFSVPLGFSGGRLVALEVLVAAFERDVLEARVGSEARLVLLVERPVESLSKTFEPEERRGASAFSLDELVLDRRSIREFFLVTGFFRSFRLWPGRILPSLSSASSTEISGTVVTYFPSTSSES